jgi:microsomal dipeptidase-like Zn-dependent dipeptidase
LPKVTAALMAKGYSKDVIKGILGGNWLRVLREVTGS